jgi:hypothetical protein
LSNRNNASLEPFGLFPGLSNPFEAKRADCAQRRNQGLVSKRTDRPYQAGRVEALDQGQEPDASVDKEEFRIVTLRVTFDTNTFDKVVRPAVYPKDPNNADFVAVHEALKRGDVLGFICETIITAEGIGRDQRASVFGSTELRRRTEEVSGDTFEITLTSEQSVRQPVHPKQAERFVAAFDLGFRLLMEGPRIGKLSVAGDFYVSETDEALTRRLDRHFKILQAIEARGLGSSRVIAIAKRWVERAAPNEHWYRLLGTARDVKETREVARAVAEWSDAESIGAHYAYGNDLFCTLDVAAGETRRGDAAILDANSRSWLSSEFGIRFASLGDLATLTR